MIDVKGTTDHIRDMSETLRRYANDIERTAKWIDSDGDIERVADVANAIANMMGNLRLDLLVSRPIRALRWVKEAKTND